MERRLGIVAGTAVLSSILSGVVRDGGGRAGNSRSPVISDVSIPMYLREK